MKKQPFMFLPSPEFDVVSVNWVMNDLALQVSAHEGKYQTVISSDDFPPVLGRLLPRQPTNSKLQYFFASDFINMIGNIYFTTEPPPNTTSFQDQISPTSQSSLQGIRETRDGQPDFANMETFFQYFCDESNLLFVLLRCSLPFLYIVAMALLPTPGSTLPNFRAPFLEAIDIGGAEPTLETVIPIFCDGSVLLFCFVALTFSIFCGDGTLEPLGPRCRIFGHHFYSNIQSSNTQISANKFKAPTF